MTLPDPQLTKRGIEEFSDSIRGPKSGRNGLAAMEEETEGNKVVRPNLSLQQNQIRPGTRRISRPVP